MFKQQKHVKCWTASVGQIIWIIFTMLITNSSLLVLKYIEFYQSINF